MKRRILAAFLSIAWLFTAAFNSLSLPATGAPIIWRAYGEDNFTTNYCGFPMDVHGSGTGIFHLFLDENGDFERIIITAADLKYSFTNQLTGESVWTPSVNMVEEEANPDGTGTKTLRGLVWALIVPGEGLVTADVGRIDWLFTFDSDGNLVSEDLVFLAGIQENQFPEMLCSVLS